MPKITKGRIWIILTLFFVIILTAISINRQVSSGVAVTTMSVSRKSITAYVDEQGYTSLPNVFHVTMPMQGRILPITLSTGEKVEKNQILAQLEDIDWQEAAIEVESIMTTFEKWLEASATQLKAAEIRQEFEKWEWDRIRELAKTSAVSEREQRDSKRNYLEANVEVESSESTYFATKALQAIIDLLPGFVERNLDRTTLKSPANGTILKRYVWNEKMMNGGEPIMEIGDMSQLEVSAEILTEEAIYINEGDPVEIYGGSLGGIRLPGSVRRIEPKAFTKISSLGVEEQRVLVRVAFTAEALEQIKQKEVALGLNYRVRIKVITKNKDNVMVVPRTALFYGAEGQWQLFKVENEAAKLTTVTLGLLNDLEAEIETGLKEKEQIITIPQSNIEDGTRVHLLP